MTTQRNLQFRSFLVWFGRIFAGILILLLGLLISGLIREAIARNEYHAKYPAPGKMINVDGHEIHLYCTGEGSPTVIFESDLDQYGILSWTPVQEEISKYTRACSYDRSGIMWSEPGPLPRDGESIAAELKSALENAGEEGPYVLAGHGFGGIYTRIFAGFYPESVAGMVLVESAHPDMLEDFSEIGLDKEIPDRNIRLLILLLSHLGSPERFKGNIYNLPDSTYNQIQAFLPESSMAWYDESVESPTSLQQAGKVQSLGEIPLIILATSISPNPSQQTQKYEELWLEIQKDLLKLSSQSEIRVYDIGHYPQLQEPEIVIEAILDVLEECKTN